MAVGQNGFQHRNSFELDYGSCEILAMSISTGLSWDAENLNRDVGVREIDLRSSSPSP